MSEHVGKASQRRQRGRGMMTEQAGWVTVPAPRWNKIHVNAVNFTSTSWKL